MSCARPTPFYDLHLARLVVDIWVVALLACDGYGDFGFSSAAAVFTAE